MTLPLTITLLAVWSAAMYRYGRSILFPPASLAVVWTITLFTIWLCGDIYYPLTTTANQIVLVGVLAFSLGGICAVAVPLSRGRTLAQVSAMRRRQVDRWLTIAGVLPVEYPFLLPVFQTTQRDDCPPRKPVETNPHCRQQGKHIRPGNSAH